MERTMQCVAVDKEEYFSLAIDEADGLGADLPASAGGLGGNLSNVRDPRCP